MEPRDKFFDRLFERFWSESSESAALLIHGQHEQFKIWHKERLSVLCEEYVEGRDLTEVSKPDMDRVGYFYLCRENIIGFPISITNSVFKDIIVLSAESNDLNNTIKYLGTSLHFDKIGQGSKIPFYECDINRDSSEDIITVSWRKTKAYDREV